MLTDKELQSLRNLGNEAEAAANEIERLSWLVNVFAGRVANLAFEMPPPNDYTPRFVMLAHAVQVEMLNGTGGPNVLANRPAEHKEQT